MNNKKLVYSPAAVLNYFPYTEHMQPESQRILDSVDMTLYPICHP